MEHLLNTYHLTPPITILPLHRDRSNNTLWVVHTGAGEYVWKAYSSPSYDDLAAIHYEHEVLRQLASAHLSFQLPRPLPDQQGQTLHATPDGYGVLLERFPGASVNPYQDHEVRLMGDALGQLQNVLERLPAVPRPGRSLFDLFFDFPEPGRNPLHLTPEQIGVPDVSPYRERLSWWRAEAKFLQVFVQTHYRSLPWQMCHNDVSLNNVLIHQEQVSAVLDFEFMTPAPRAFDAAMALRMTMQTWERPEPWDTVRAFFEGYTRWMHLTEPEVLALPMLIRLRGVMGMLLWLSRNRDNRHVFELIEYHQTRVQWLEQYERQFVDVMLPIA